MQHNDIFIDTHGLVIGRRKTQAWLHFRGVGACAVIFNDGGLFSLRWNCAGLICVCRDVRARSGAACARRALCLRPRLRSTSWGSASGLQQKPWQDNPPEDKVYD